MSKKSSYLWLFKFIGILLFIWIFSKIDVQELSGYIAEAQVSFLLVSLVCIALIYACKTLRWHTFVRSAGGTCTVYESWKILNIGAFLAIITPGKLGEFGRAAYLQNRNVPLKKGLVLSLLDRVADAIAIVILGILGAGVLLGSPWITISWLVIAIGMVIVLYSWRWIRMLSWVTRWLIPFSNKDVLMIVLWTLIGWVLYFAWAVCLARSIAIDVPTITLVAIFIFTGLVSMIPAAPSGLGTRDAALLTLLTPYGVAAEQAVALAMLMLGTIILSCMIGAWYCIKGDVTMD